MHFTWKSVFEGCQEPYESLCFEQRGWTNVCTHHIYTSDWVSWYLSRTEIWSRHGPWVRSSNQYVVQSWVLYHHWMPGTSNNSFINWIIYLINFIVLFRWERESFLFTIFKSFFVYCTGRFGLYNKPRVIHRRITFRIHNFLKKCPVFLFAVPEINIVAYFVISNS